MSRLSGRGVLLDLEPIAQMAGDVARVFHELPETLLVDPGLTRDLTDPIEEVARDIFGPWVCEIVTTRALGVNLKAHSDDIRGDEASFVGLYDHVTLETVALDPVFSEGLERGTVPVLIFDTLDNKRFAGTIAQMYSWVGVPLVGTVVCAERFPLMWEADS